MFFIDIAVPRDVDPRMNEVEGCFVYDIDDLQQVAQANQADRHREAAAAETIVSGEVDRYQQRVQGLDSVPAIKALMVKAEAIREEELRRSASGLAGMTAAQRAAVEALTRGLTKKLLHPQLALIRAAAESGDPAALASLKAIYGSQANRTASTGRDEDEESGPGL
jgi:glutamyl-tRNA reductase